jgi:uncharacterized protein (TIGR02118 family)
MAYAGDLKSPGLRRPCGFKSRPGHTSPERRVRPSETFMVKFVVVLRRKPDWTSETFRDYFIRVHGPLAAKIPGLRRYKQNFPAPGVNRKAPEWDCVVELYFDDQQAMEAAWSTAEGAAASADVEVFADMSWSSWSIVEERVVIP